MNVRMQSLLTGSFLRFLLVGLLNTFVGTGISFVLFNALHAGYWPSTFIGNTAGAVVSYVLNRAFTFRSSVSVGSSWWKFALVILFCYGFSYGASMLLARAAAALLDGSISSSLLHNGAILAGTGIYTITNYFGHKYVTFRSRASENSWKRGAS